MFFRFSFHFFFQKADYSVKNQSLTMATSYGSCQCTHVVQWFGSSQRRVFDRCRVDKEKGCAFLDKAKLLADFSRERLVGLMVLVGIMERVKDWDSLLRWNFFLSMAKITAKQADKFITDVVKRLTEMPS